MVGGQPLCVEGLIALSMKLLHVVASYLPATRYGGTIVSVHGLCKALAARGHEVHVFTTSVDGRGDSAVAHGEPVDVDGVAVWYFQSRYFRRLYYAPAMAAALRAGVAGFDVVHSHAIYLWPLWAASSAAARAGVPHVISPRGMLEHELIQRQTAFWKSMLIGFIEKRRLEAAAAIHVTSARERDQAERFGFSFPPFYEVPNGTDVDETDAGQPSGAIAALAQGRPFVLFLGRVNWKKGLDRLLGALRLAPSATLVVAGTDEDDYRRMVEARASSLGVSDRVTFTGEVLGADKRALIESARALVLPSYSENFGNVVLEAWVRGRPVIVTPEVGLADVVEQSGGGWVAGTPEALGQLIEYAVTNPAAASLAGESGRVQARNSFTWDAVAGRMETVYSAVARAR
jgi:glycosyltransferase involved in cell wall biosynthesis